MKKTILYYTDCHFFGGSENMIANFFNSKELANKYNLILMYSQSDEYDKGLHSRVHNEISVIPQKVYDHYKTFSKIDKLTESKILRKIFKLIVLLTTKYPNLLLNIHKFKKIISQLNPDLIHINNGGYPAAYSTISMGIAARKLKNIPVIYIVNNIAQGYKSPDRWADIIFDKLLVNKVSCFITGSKNAAGVLKKCLKINDEKIINIYNCISERPVIESPDTLRIRLSIPADRQLFSCIGILEKRKGQINLLKAIALLKPDHNELPFFVLEGTGSEMNILAEYITENSLQNDVKIISNEKNIVDLINASDVIILPSICCEDFPNVVIESMSFGKPVISTKIAGIPEQIDNGKTGILIDPGDVKALADAIVYLMDNRDIAKEYGRNARAKYDAEFSRDICFKKYMKIYSNLIDH